MGNDFEARIRNVTAVLGPTNTGKTHLAIERMLGHESGMIGLPLRLLAREVYDKIKARVGSEKVALITGEEKIKPERARYWVSTVEAMPREVDVDFLAIDEVQLAGDPERGHVFTDRLLHARGRSETLLLGSQTMREAISDLIPGANFISRPRLSKLMYAGEKKITRLPARSAIVAFSAQDVYAIAELIRRQRGGAAVVLGALSPRTRNAQVALYQSGDVEFLVATDAIGMGLNLDVDHVAFSALRKFDGYGYRNLTPGELGQIAGRAGRHMNDGTFGVTGGAEPLDAELVERLETHSFEAVRVLQWRNRSLDFGTLDRLHNSLREMPREARLVRCRTADDVAALEAVSSDREVRELCAGPAAVSMLWDVCQVPDYRKISGSSHAELVATLYKFLRRGEEKIPEDWFAKQVAFADRTDGDIDTLANRIAHIRTWTFVSNRPDWLKDPGHWQGRTREIEDSLSDALHERLTQRFVDRRTSALMKSMRDKDELNAEFAEDGSITVENHFVGRLKGFRFTLDSSADGIHEKATRAAATHVLARELGMRARRVAAAQNDAFKLTRNGRIVWRDDEIARLEAAEDPLAPSVHLLADEHLAESDKERVTARLQTWIKDLVADKLKPLMELSGAQDLQGLARGIAFRLKEGFGVLKRDSVADEINALDQPSRASLRKYGLRFGAFNIYFPALMKPAAAELSATLFALKHAGAHGLDLDSLPALPRPGLTSVAVDTAVPEIYYRAYGFHTCGPRAVRLDILERLADLIRPLLAWRQNPDSPALPPKGSTGDGGFKATEEMMSILGCSAEELGNVLKALGFRLERRPVPAAKSSLGAPAAGDSQPPVSGGEAVESLTAEVSEAGSQTVVSPAEPAQSALDIAATPTDEGGAAEEPSKPEEEAATAEATVEYEDVWRPRRHRRDDRRERGGRHHGRHGQRGGARTAPAAEAVAGAPAAESAEAKPESAAGGVRDQQSERSHRRDKHRREGGDRQHEGRERSGHPGQGQERQGQERQGQERQGQGRRADNRNEGDRRDNAGRGPKQGRERDRREDRRGRAPEVITAAPPKRGGMDPDSPFAALAALKASMDKRGEG